LKNLSKPKQNELKNIYQYFTTKNVFSFKKEDKILLISKWKDDIWVSENNVEFKSMKEIVKFCGFNESEFMKNLPEENKIFKSKFYFKLVGDHFCIFKCLMDSKIDFKFNGINFILRNSEISKITNEYECNINELEIGLNSIKFKERKGVVTSRNSIEFQNSKTHDFFMCEEVKILKYLPEYLQQFPCHFMSNSKFKQNEIINSNDLVQITPSKQFSIIVNGNASKHDFDYQFVFPEYTASFFVNSLEEGNYRNNSNQKLFEFRTLKEFNFKSEKFDSISRGTGNIQKIKWKKETAFLEFHGNNKEKLFLIRIPLHPRDHAEFFYLNDFNSLFDENFQNPFDLKLIHKKLNDLHFKFQY
jgi:hypothetical protein